MINSQQTSDFEATTPATGDWVGGTGCTLSRITSDFDTGIASLQAVTDTTTFRNLRCQPTAAKLPVRMETMTMWIRVKAVTQPCTLDFTIGWFNASDVQIGGNVNYSPATVIGTSWVLMNCGAINPPALSVTAVPSISIKEASSTVKFDNFVFDYLRIPHVPLYPNIVAY